MNGDQVASLPEPVPVSAFGDGQAQGGARFSFDGTPVADTHQCPNIIAFCAYMAAAVSHRRSGKASDYLNECHDFMGEVVGRKLSIMDPLPDDYDWTVASARDAAEAMMECDA